MSNQSHLPFDEDHFAAVVSQFGLMFFPDPVRAIHEVLRCVAPEERVACRVGRTGTHWNARRPARSPSIFWIDEPVRQPPKPSHIVAAQV